jgi:short-subunit dehydrogenase
MFQSKNTILFFILFLSFSAVQASQPRKKAIIIGATSGMGRATAKLLAKKYDVGLTGRRTELLDSLQNEIKTTSYIKRIDVSEPEAAQEKLSELILEMGGLDLIFISISGYFDNLTNTAASDWKKHETTIDVDFKGFIAMADLAFEFFKTQGRGHLIGISSISGMRGDANSPVYCAAKAGVSTYLDSLRNYSQQNNLKKIYITDIIPGWVDVERTTFSDQPGTYWVTSLEKAAHQIFDGIEKKEKRVYISKRQVLVAWMLRLLPDYLYNQPWWPVR